MLIVICWLKGELKMKFKVEIKETRNYFHTLVFDAEATREEVKAALKDIEADKANNSLEDIICDLEHYGATNIAKEVGTEGCCDTFQTTTLEVLMKKETYPENLIKDEIISILSWRCGDNAKSALRYDKNTETILIDEDRLMKVLQLISPSQTKRNLSIVKGLIKK